MAGTSVHQWGDTPHLWSMSSDDLLRHAVEGLAAGDPVHLAFGGKVSERPLEEVIQGCKFDTLFQAESHAITHVLLRDTANPLTFISLNHDRSASSYSATALAPNQELARRALDDMLGQLPPVQVNDHSAVVHFWSLGMNGAQDRTRRIETNVWDDIQDNYADRTKSAVNNLLTWKCAPDGGRLMVFHGQPGTGKTHVIRGLAHEWRNWCDLHYVVDSEMFFGSASYMLSVLLQTDDDDDVFETPVSTHPSRIATQRWRLIVVEDADELLRKDAKHIAGQNLSRLLNLCDGLIGQGLRVLVLLTTNEKLTDLHAAIIRPGRCVAEIEFNALAPAEATAWLGEPVAKDATIAELYEMKRHEKVSQVQAAAPLTGVYL